MESIIGEINEYLAGYALLALLISAGVWFTIRTRFIQIRCLGEGFRNMFGKKQVEGQGGLSSLQSVSTAIAAQVGTGNIVGAADAIIVGGPGAIFWMWVIAFFGMATSYAETVLAIRTRRRDADGNFLGGPVFYIRQAFSGWLGRFLAAFFAVALVVALGFAGSMVQSNAVSSAVQKAFGIEPWVVGAILVALCALIFWGGIQRIGAVAVRVVPVMGVLFLGGGLVVLAMRAEFIPETFAMIFHSAFAPQSIIGGTFGYAIMKAVTQGARRGLFSNEAGMGSTPHAHAQANAPSAHYQGTIAMIGVFVDTFVVLTINALIIISTLYASDGPLHEGVHGALADVFTRNNLSALGFGSVLGEQTGSMIVAISLMFFAFTSILGWCAYGRINAIYLFGGKSKHQLHTCVGIYTFICLIFIFLGTIASSGIVWQLSDLFNYLMVFPNIPAMLALTAWVIAESKNNKDLK